VHVVQFYDDDAFLADAVAAYLGPAVEAGEPVVVIATAEHRDAFVRRLSLLPSDRRVTLLDAGDTLDQLLVGGMPDAARFRAVVGAAIGKGCARAYGEMVDVLNQRGDGEAAVRLEELWNELARERSFSLLCAYRLRGFADQSDGDRFARICATHSDVIPAEGYTRLQDPETQRREISRLQRQAHALEAEARQRQAVEGDLRRALQQRDEFLSMAGHELKTPLTAVRLMAHSLVGLSESRSDRQFQDRAAKAARAVDRLAKLVDDLLDVKQMQAGSLQLSPQPVDLGRLVADVAESLREPLALARCELNLTAGQPVIGWWDAARIEQVIVNLLSNAMKYGGGQPIEVTVDWASSGSGGEAQARLTVRDHGVGIASSDQERIFERFERASPSDRVWGLGLGLWIVKQIVQAHRGTIAVASSAGRGAAFVVTLPLAVAS
jgi:signal transduction histidine kinase